MSQTFTLHRIALNVGALAAAARFYCEALGFVVARPEMPDAALARVLGVRAVRTVHLRRGAQLLELSVCQPAGAAMPAGGHANDAWFQHCALVTDDIGSAYEKLRGFAFTPISRNGPQTLPGGVSAFKFRDPEGHPLELIAFPTPDPATAGGIDHSAICVADPARSIAFYTARLGLAVRQRQVNEGPAQDALDDLSRTTVDVIAMAGPVPGPHVELLHYRTPQGGAGVAHPNDIAASRLVFCGAAPQPDAELDLLHDPDGHAVLLDYRSWPIVAVA